MEAEIEKCAVERAQEELSAEILTRSDTNEGPAAPATGDAAGSEEV